MLRSIERVFFWFVQRIELMFALVSFVAVIILGFVSYEKLNTKASDTISVPVIYFSQYQNSVNDQQQNIEKSITKTVDVFNSQDQSAFLADIDTIVSSLEQLIDQVVSKNNLRDRVEMLVKIKSSVYSKELQLAYAASLAELTQKMVKVSGDQIDVDDFIDWHDKEFSTQVGIQTQRNLLKMNSIKSQKIAGFVTLNMAAAMLGIFIMFVMMLAMLRIEKNTRR